MKPPKISPQAALAGLWLRAASIAALAIYLLLRRDPNPVTLIDVVASTALSALWTLLMGEYLRGGQVLLSDPRREWLTRLYPWLIAYEGAIWLLYSFDVLLGGLPEADPIALIVLALVWGASILVSFLMFTQSVRLMSHPEDTTGRVQFAELLNWAAALTAASTVMNVVKLGGTPGPTVGDQWAFGLQGVVEVAALLLLRWALRGGEAAVGSGE
ncbi:hypothetical protein [Deinococcus sp.]|uniref:hypothetical protein n=1 Tax=Deinococcus sp. TaxID=47478 RepID=UPI003CC5769F